MTTKKQQERIKATYRNYVRAQLKSARFIKQDRSFETRKYIFAYKGTLRPIATEGNSIKFEVIDKKSGNKHIMIRHEYRSFTSYEFR